MQTANDTPRICLFYLESLPHTNNKGTRTNSDEVNQRSVYANHKPYQERSQILTKKCCLKVAVHYCTCCHALCMWQMTLTLLSCLVATYKYKYHLDLVYPDVVTDEFGNTGFWTLIYNQVWNHFHVCCDQFLIQKCIYFDCSCKYNVKMDILE